MDKNMSVQDALLTLKRYNEGGFVEFTSFADFYNYFQKHIGEIKQRIHFGGEEAFSTEYIRAILISGSEYHKLPERNGQFQTIWGVLAELLRKEIEFRSTLEGTKHMLTCLLASVKLPEVKEIGKKLYEKYALIKSTPCVGRKEQKTLKNQYELIMKRISKIIALEHENEFLLHEAEKYRDLALVDIENMLPMEECERMAKKDFKKNQWPALLLSWAVMPFYTIIKSLEFIFDSLFVVFRKEDGLEQKIGGEPPVLGKLCFPMIIGFYLAMTTLEGADFNPLSIGVAGICYTGIAAFVMALISIPISYVMPVVTEKIGDVCFNASVCFIALNKNEIQRGAFTNHYELLQQKIEKIKENQLLIKELRELVENNKPYYPAVDYQL